MLKKSLLVIVLLGLLLPGALADDHVPTVAILRFGPVFSLSLVQDVVVSSIQSAGLITDEEAIAFRQTGQKIEGERIRLVGGDANLNFPNINAIVDAALDEGADVIVTLSTPVTLAALNATLDLDDPPIILFAAVYNPYAAGIAQSPCIKPSHVTGVEAVTNYEDILPLLLLQDPDIQTVGTIFSASETSGRVGAEEIAAVGAEMGLEVLTASVVSIADLLPAAEGLVENGAEAFLIPADMLTVAGLPALMQVASENGIPVFHSVTEAIRDGATVGAGVGEGRLQGALIGALLAGHLNGEIDISASGITSLSDMTVRVNMDAAELHGIVISEALMERADGLMEDGRLSGKFATQLMTRLGIEPGSEMARQFEIALVAAQGGGPPVAQEEISPEVQAIVDRVMARQNTDAQLEAAIAEASCTDEMIAEQQAELDAAGE